MSDVKIPKEPMPFLQVNSDRKSLRMATKPMTKPVDIEDNFQVATDMPTAAVEETIVALSDARAQMLPEVPKQFDISQKVTFVRDPAYWVSVDTIQNNPTLCIRHPGLGWLTFSLPKEEAVSMGKLLQQQAERKDPGGLKN